MLAHANSGCSLSPDCYSADDRYEDITTLLEDSQMTLQTMMASRFVVGIRDTVEVWDRKMMQLSQTLDEWMTCQRNWMYLESIFGQGDIQKQLPDEAAKFLKVDQFWKETMRATHKAPNVVEAATTDEGLLKKFADANALLEQVLIAAAATTGIPRDTVPLCRSKSRSRTTC